MPYLISRRQGDAEQRADADVHPGAAQPQRPVHLRRQGVRRPQRSASTPRRSRPRSTKKKASGKAVKAAMTFPGGTHDLWIRYWLAAGGIDPDKDIATITVPPPQMVANMKVGTMDCFCVVRAVEPAARQPGHRLHRHHHRRALEQAPGEVARHARGLGRQATRTPPRRILMAVMEAQQWCEKPENNAGGRQRSAPSASGSTCRSTTSSTASRASSTTAPGKVVEKHPQIMKYWKRPRLLSLPEPRPVVPHRGHPLGQVRAHTRRQGADQEGQPRGPVARGGQGAGRPGRPDPGLHLARQGDLLRRQGLRSRRSAWPTSRACRSSAPEA